MEDNHRDAKWLLDAGSASVVLTTNSGLVEPEALVIWEAEFGDRTMVPPFAVSRPSDDLPEIRFSRFPLELTLVARGSTADGLQAALTARVGGRDIDLPIPVPRQLVVDGCWYIIDVESVSETAAALASVDVDFGDRINVGQLVWLRGQRDLPVPFRDQTTHTEAGCAALHPIAEIRLRLGTALYSYQQSGIAFLASVARDSLGCVLADEMGLGKTLQVIALLSIENAGGRFPNLIICPATLLENWRREIDAFAPQLKVLVHAGPQRTGNPATFAAFDAVIVSYDTVIRDEPLLSATKWNVVALDEAQNIKNPDAQRTTVVKGLKRRVSLAVTGTPVENRLTDLWSIADFALPGLLGSRNAFELAYDDSHEDAGLLAPVVAPILLRRKVADVAKDLPPRIDVPQAIPMPRVMGLQYESIRQEIARSYGSSANLVALGKLRQYCSHPRLLGIAWDDPAAGMPKYLRLVEILEEIFSLGQKVLIFTSFTEMADILMDDIPKRFTKAWAGLIDGRVAVAERQLLIDRFSAHEGYGFLALNPKAAGVGLNITAANHVIHYNPEWNPALEDQASARAYRRKQLLPVTVHHLYFVDSVEEIVVERLDLKRKLATGALIGHQGDVDSTDIARALQVSPLATQDSFA